MDTEPAEQLLEFTRHSEPVECCALSADSKLVVSGDEGSSVMVSCENTHMRDYFNSVISHPISPTPSLLIMYVDMEV